MKKRLFAAGMAALLSLSLLSGCTISGVLYGNDRSNVYRMGVSDNGTEITFLLPELECLVYDRAEGSLTLSATEGERPAVVLEGDTFRGAIEAAEGYEGLKEHLYALAVSPDEPLITALAYEEDGTVYGFCNVYFSATGFLSGGGRIDAKKIERGVLFSYYKERDEFIVQATLENRVVVAYDGTNCIYLDKETYYSESMESHVVVEICDDEAYDTGFTSYSYARFYFGGDYCILYFYRDMRGASRYHAYILVTMEGEKLAELRIIPDDYIQEL